MAEPEEPLRPRRAWTPVESLTLAFQATPAGGTEGTAEGCGPLTAARGGGACPCFLVGGGGVIERGLSGAGRRVTLLTSGVLAP